LIQEATQRLVVRNEREETDLRNERLAEEKARAPAAAAKGGVRAVAASASRPGTNRSGAPAPFKASERLGTGASKKAVVVEEDDGVRAGKLNAAGAVLPPWSCILHGKVRYQPTTLMWKVHELPNGMQRALKSLDAKRYQPMSAEHGLPFKLRDAVPGGSCPQLERIFRDETPAPREGVASPRIHKFAHPTWWGCGPKDSEAQKLSSSYEDLGENFRERGFHMQPTESINVPTLDGRYIHDNPYMAQFGKRTDGGSVVFDVSVCDKRGCCLRDPNCPKVVTRGY